MHMQMLLCLRCYYYLCAVIIYDSFVRMHFVGGLYRRPLLTIRKVYYCVQ